MQTIADAFFQGVNAKQRKTENEYRKQLFERGERDYQEQRKAKDAFGRAVSGDESALPDLARADPGSYIQYQTFKTGQKTADIKQKREAAQYAVDTLGTIELMPPQQRPQAYAAARAEAARLGYDTSGIPEQYDPVAVRTAALRSKSVLEFLSKQSENAITTSPGTPGLFGGGAPGFNGGSFGGGGNPSAPLGERNNNPLNIRKTGEQWQGKVNGDGKGFEVFESPEAGIRAAVVNMRTLQGNGLGNLVELIEGKGKPGQPGYIPGWAPPTENNSAAYVKSVVDATGLDPWKPLNLNDPATVGKVVKAMIAVENGRVTYGDDVIGRGLQMAGLGGQAPQGGAQAPQQPGPQMAQAPGGPAADAGVQPLYRGGKPFNDGLPAGYQWGQDQQGNRVQMRIPGGRAQLKQVTLDDGVWNVDEFGKKVEKLGERPNRNEGEGREFTQEQKLRADYARDTKDFVDMRQHFTRLQAASSQNDGAGDIAMVYSYMKMLDPTSVVREGEFATAANAGGVPDRVIAMYNGVINGQRLSPEVRAQFVQQGSRQFEQSYNQYEATQKEYGRLAGEYGLQPNRVVIDRSGGVGRPQIGGPPPPAGGGQPGAAQPGQPQQGNAPRAVNPATGETIILRDGQWVPEGR